MFQRFFQRDNQIEWTLLPKTYANGSREHHSGKVLLPQICLATLVEKQVNTPYVFKISAHGGIAYTHAGVHEFTDEIQDIVLPQWMYDQLTLDEHPVTVTCAELPKGSFIRLLPQSKEFLEIENPKPALESALRNYQVLSPGDTISLYFEEEFKHILFTVSEIKPAGEGISIIDTDLEVDFLPPADYEVIPVQTADSLVVKKEDQLELTDPFYHAKPALGVVFMGIPN
ncbi:ubiquitin fusion degradation protein 1 [Nematocida homosporus]|uniref:ubiquitin fusion degradation protein 1 n=1 Tax=Nematocida homosporus TaxID=1912981 RepID=UPI00221E999B|nr:ubiquitin fusion degradation protein 1 [Nematocida homosporus]KAI5184525.1 ubiquitin fusion degradation protein 1 [Nematocida homosporus]